MLKKLIIPCLAVFVATLLTGCVISFEKRHHHHPDACYDCHYGYELDRRSVDVTCSEFIITVDAGGYWYRPAGTDVSPAKFHMFKAHDDNTVLGPAGPQG